MTLGELIRIEGLQESFELADAAGEVIFIGRADARTLFGLRGEVAARVAALPEARAFRVGL